MSRGNFSAYPETAYYDGQPTHMVGGLTIREHVIIEMAKAMIGTAAAPCLTGLAGAEAACAQAAARMADALIVEFSISAQPSPTDDALEILRALLTAKHVDLGDLVYQVREREGQGWDGPAVTAWSDTVSRAKKLVQP